MFFKGSRYAEVPEHGITDRQGRTLRYKRIRFVAGTQARLGHRVAAGERLDHVAYRYYRDPELFWRICDANDALWPDELTVETGRLLAIPPARS
ncbi:MAG: hypothetical protein QNK18_17975 [Gammaproteobacteria bacterium]|nr:hypothetical protein [Gammaproteobacteria bacterium]